MKRLIAFLCGLASFAVTQIFLRIPLIAHFDFEFSVLSVRGPFLALLILAFSAGLFEETGRFLFYKTALRQADFTDAMLFGLGHSLMEILFLFYSAGVSPGLGLSAWAILERLSATLFHMAQSVYILAGIRGGRGIRALLYAIFFHALFNLTALTLESGSILVGECAIFAIAVVYLFLATRKKQTIEEAI